MLANQQHITGAIYHLTHSVRTTPPTVHKKVDACQSWWVASRHLSAVSAAEHCGPNQCMSLSPGGESYQIIAGAFICFSHLTDQAFIWDRRLIPSSQKPLTLTDTEPQIAPDE